jgi:hypothetical protein
MVDDQKDNGAASGNQYAMEVQSVHSDVTEHMKQPTAYDRSDDAQENVENETFTTPVDDMESPV